MRARSNMLWTASLGVTGFILLDLMSWLGWSFPVWGSIIAILLTLSWLVYALASNVSVVVGWLVVELILGSFGRTFSLVVGGTVLPLRMLLFLAASAVMILIIVREKGLTLPKQLKIAYGLAAAAIAWGLLIGVLNDNQLADIFFDANGYLYIFLLPLFYKAARQADFKSLAQNLILPALIWLSLKAALALYIFSHIPYENIAPLYHWWRQTGVGEITPAGANWFRIFSQSQIYAVLSAVAGLAYYFFSGQENKKLSKLIGWFTWFNLVTTIISLSRSYWLGLAIGWLAAIIYGKHLLKSQLNFFKKIIISIFLILSAAGVVALIPLLPPRGSTSAGALLGRFQVEAAGQSRLSLLPPLWKAIRERLVIGSGYGALITYKSTDPRNIKSTAGGSGIVTTYAFEWGYLDMWLKVGIIGLILWCGAIIAGFKRAWDFRGDKEQATVLVVMIALFVVHATTPYLNHPLGIGALMALLSYSNTKAYV